MLVPELSGVLPPLALVDMLAIASRSRRVSDDTAGRLMTAYRRNK